MRFLMILAAALGLATQALAQAAAPVDTRALLAANTRPFRLAPGAIDGPGVDFLLGQLANAQFVLLGESHHDRDVPVFAGALFARLQQERGFRYLVVEQDPLAMEAMNGFHGDVAKAAALVRRYPPHIGFASDADLALLAAVSKGSKPGDPVIWGVEQAQGATRYLEELVTLAPTPAARTAAQALHDEARAKETREAQAAFLHDDATALPRLKALQAAFSARPGSRADRLLTGLVTSAEIYSYNRRAIAGERVGLYNNTEREALFKRTFMADYRRAAKGGALPRAMFKFGSWHMYRGRSPGSAFTIGNFAHEFAIANGMEAYGVDVVPVGDGYQALADIAPWMSVFFPDGAPGTPVILDLRPLKPYARAFTSQVELAQQWELRDYLHGHDAVVVLPGSRKATWDLTGFPVP